MGRSDARLRSLFQAPGDAEKLFLAAARGGNVDVFDQVLGALSTKVFLLFVRTRLSRVRSLMLFTLMGFVYCGNSPDGISRLCVHWRFTSDRYMHMHRRTMLICMSTTRLTGPTGLRLFSDGVVPMYSWGRCHHCGIHGGFYSGRSCAKYLPLVLSLIFQSVPLMKQLRRCQIVQHHFLVASIVSGDGLP